MDCYTMARCVLSKSNRSHDTLRYATKGTGTMRTLGIGIVASLVLLAGAGCAEDDGGMAPEPMPPTTPPSTVRQALAAGVTLDLQTPGSDVAFDLRRTYNAGELVPVNVGVLGGSLTLRAAADGSLAVEGLAMDIDDMVTSPETLPPEGLHLTALHLGLLGFTAGNTTWTGDGEARLEAALETQLDWALLAQDGRALPLAPQKPPLPFTLQIRRDAAGALVAEAGATSHGVFWTWAGAVELSDLVVNLRASDAGQAPE
jgi:hypothetical protein